MTLKESVFAWAARKALADGVDPHHFLVQEDGFVYAMPEASDDGAVAWWPLPYLGVDGERALESGDLLD